MAVPTKFGAIRGTTGSAFTTQDIKGVVLGATSTTSGVLGSSLSVMDSVKLNAGVTSQMREVSSANAIYATKKPLSGGTYAYMDSRKFIISKFTTTLSGVSKTQILFMGSQLAAKDMNDFKHDFGVRMLTAWRTGRFAWTGKLANGNTKNSRQMWLNQDGTAVTKPTVLNNVNMRDLADGNATDKAVDNAVAVTRAVPGEFIVYRDFVNSNISTSANFYNYKPITGA